MIIIERLKEDRFFLLGKLIALHQLKLNKIYNMDCVDGLKLLSNNMIDLTVTSPPYDNLRTYKNGCSFNFEELAKELYRVTKQGGIVVWVVSDATINGSETGTSFKQALYFKEIGFNLHDTMIFKKRNPMPQVKRKRYMNEFEFMFVFSKGKPNTCNYIMVETKNAGKDMSKSTFKNYSKSDNKKRNLKKLKVKDKKIKGNVWEYLVGHINGDDRIAFEHPAPFPEALARDHIISWTNEGDIVLDPFMGSGTVAKMALLNNRKYIGFEKSKEYIKIAEKRINMIAK